MTEHKYRKPEPDAALTGAAAENLKLREEIADLRGRIEKAIQYTKSLTDEYDAAEVGFYNSLKEILEGTHGGHAP